MGGSGSGSDNNENRIWDRGVQQSTPETPSNMEVRAQPTPYDTHAVGPLSYTTKRIKSIAGSGLHRTIRYGRVSGAYITIDGHKLINLCSNDYLGLGASPLPPDGSTNMKEHNDNDDCDCNCNCDMDAQFQASSRLLAGSDTAHMNLEEELAAHKSYESALLYPTGYMANTGILPVLAGKNDVILSDELNHASIIDGCRLARGADTITYRHNDPGDLELKIPDGCGNKIIITEGVFSMDGDVPPLGRIADVASKTGSILVVDDAHGDFVMGDDGRGTPQHLGLTDSSGNGVHVYTSSLSKGLGSFGGYVASDRSVIDLCINQSRSFIYTSAPPPILAEHALVRIRSAGIRMSRKKRLADNTRLLRDALGRAGYATASKTHIMPIMIKSEECAVRLAKKLYKSGIYALPIRYPTVPRGEARLRIVATAWLSERDIQNIGRAFEGVGSI